MNNKKIAAKQITIISMLIALAGTQCWGAANPNTNADALLRATMAGDITTARQLINAKANIEIVDERNNFTALQIAALGGHVEIVSLLIAANANIKAVTKDGDTALTLATKQGHTTTVAIIEKALAGPPDFPAIAQNPREVARPNPDADADIDRNADENANLKRNGCCCICNVIITSPHAAVARPAEAPRPAARPGIAVRSAAAAAPTNAS